MNTPTADASTTEPQGVAAAPASRRVVALNTMVMLVRRELWENRALWIAPLLIAGLLILCALPASMNFHLDIDQASPYFDEGHRAVLYAMGLWILTLPQFVVMAIILNFYLLDCLFAERKDRSILFWKSLPLSDEATVGSKLLAAIVVVPLGVYVLAMVTTLLFTVVWDAQAALAHSDAPVLWDTMAWLRFEALVLVCLMAAVLWYAPIAAYLLLVSAWARRSVFLWAVLPWVVAPILERIAFGTHHITHFMGSRFGGLWAILDVSHAVKQTMVDFGPAQLPWLGGVLANLDIRSFLTNIEVWLGVIAAGAFAFAAARIRRYRDDS